MKSQADDRPVFTFAADRGDLVFFCGSEEVGRLSGCDAVGIAALISELGAAMKEAR
jgi:hypothetical protein